MPRNGDGHAGVHSSDADVYPAFETGVVTNQCEGSQRLGRKTDMGRFQWVTDDEGVANFLQRPPSRQKEAFPTHLADVVPYTAFQVMGSRTIILALGNFGPVTFFCMWLSAVVNLMSLSNARPCN